MLAYCDNTDEPLAGMMRRGGAGSNTVTDHLTVLEESIAALPPAYRRRLMVTVDGAGASHGLIARLDKLATRPGHQLVYSVGWDLGERERDAIRLVPPQAWQVAVDHRGEVRERRADDACADQGCAHPRCWREEAHVTELTGLLRGPGRDQLAGWPASMRVFARGVWLWLRDQGLRWPLQGAYRRGQDAEIEAVDSGPEASTARRVSVYISDQIMTTSLCAPTHSRRQTRNSGGRTQVLRPHRHRHPQRGSSL